MVDGETFENKKECNQPDAISSFEVNKISYL
jgi:hypothetical protein